MRSMMLRNRPFDELSLFEQWGIDPFNQLQRRARQQSMEGTGTKDNPVIVTRGEWVERQYKAWHEEDGSYHEQLIDADDLSELPTKPEGTI